jgi:hypothetical protein
MPYWTVAIQTHLSVQAARERVRALVRPRKGFREGVADAFDLPEDGPPFQGEVSERSFKVIRVIRHRSSFVPVIHGVIEEGPNGATVRLHLRLHLFTAGVMLLWFGLLIPSFKVSFDEPGPWGLNVSTPAAMVLFGVLLVLGSFFPEVTKAVTLFREALQS